MKIKLCLYLHSTHQKKTKLIHSKDVPQGPIIVRYNEIEVVKEYVSLGWIVNINQNMDVEISQRIRSELKAFQAIGLMSRVFTNGP